MLISSMQGENPFDSKLSEVLENEIIDEISYLICYTLFR